jgi:predicted DNA-binding transcriptional regulator YafY
MSDRLRRLLLLVPAARAKPGIHLSELARSLACTEAELRKDVDLLACVGAPPFLPDDLIDIELRDDRVYVSLPRAFNRPTRLLATEAAALVIAARALAPHDPLTQAASEKLTKAIAPGQKPFYEALLAKFATTPAETSEEVESIVRQAIAEQRELEITYFARTENSTRPRVIKPRIILTVDTVSYLSAQKDDGADRTYRLDRIAHAKLLDRTFEPLYPIDQQATMERIARFDQQPDLARATIRFAPAVASTAKSRYPDARAVDGGAVDIDLAYSTVPWIVSFALSWGGAAEIVSPPEARAALKIAVEQALESHR